MDKHVFLCETELDYEYLDYETPHVALTEGDSIVYYDSSDNQLLTIYNLFDILWSDGKATQNVRPVSDGVIPVGLCVIPTNWLGPNKKARFMSLKYMVSDVSENDGLHKENLYWGAVQSNSELLGDRPFNYPYLCKDETRDSDRVEINYFWKENNEIKDLRKQENWNYTYNYCKENPGKYAIGDINGKQNTKALSIEGNYYSDIYRDIKTCTAKFAPQGTEIGEWYIPAIGELILFSFMLDSKKNNPSINSKLSDISKIYPQHCIATIDDGISFWSSDMNGVNHVFTSYVYSNTNIGVHSSSLEPTYSCGIAFLQR